MEATANAYKEPAEVNAAPAAEPKPQRRASRKNWLYESLDLSRWVHYQTIIRNLPFIFFLAGVGILYIANAHYAEQNVREVSDIEKRLNELRWEYMTTKSELEYMRKQSEVARMVAADGLIELREPPRKITVTGHEH